MMRHDSCLHNAYLLPACTAPCLRSRTASRTCYVSTRHIRVGRPTRTWWKSLRCIGLSRGRDRRSSTKTRQCDELVSTPPTIQQAPIARLSRPSIVNIAIIAIGRALSASRHLWYLSANTTYVRLSTAPRTSSGSAAFAMRRSLNDREELLLVGVVMSAFCRILYRLSTGCTCGTKYAPRCKPQHQRPSSPR
jgi:hypothetical protein